ncbi:hypothetical protein AgCh_003734 [Apium graveolens]
MSGLSHHSVTGAANAISGQLAGPHPSAASHEPLPGFETPWKRNNIDKKKQEFANTNTIQHLGRPGQECGFCHTKKKPDDTISLVLELKNEEICVQACQGDLAFRNGNAFSGQPAGQPAATDSKTVISIAPPVFDGENYHIWAARMEAYLEANDLWKPVEEDYELPHLADNPTMAQLREFEMQRMKESETIKVYSDRLLGIANKVKLLGTDFPDSRIVQKILFTLPEKFEVTISSLENSKDLSNITLTELLNALKAQEQRRLMREEGS